jgi:hypothetical protein
MLLVDGCDSWTRSVADAAAILSGTLATVSETEKQKLGKQKTETQPRPHEFDFSFCV